VKSSSGSKWLAIFFVLILILIFGLAGSLACAQDATGRIIGNVTDPSGGAITGAKVTVTNTGTTIAQTTTTDSSGYYQVLSLPIGYYQVKVEAQGFRQELFQQEKLEINQSLRLDAKLAIGQTSETVEVTSQAANVETVSETIGSSVEGETILRAPLNGRNVLDLAALQPGVTETNGDSTAAGTYSIAGGRSDSVTYLLDGGLNNNLLDNSVVLNPNPDTIAEFRILESNYSAEYGRNGGGIISVVTKSGTNEWHGSGFEFLRNDAEEESVWRHVRRAHHHSAFGERQRSIFLLCGLSGAEAVGAGEQWNVSGLHTRGIARRFFGWKLLESGPGCGVIPGTDLCERRPWQYLFPVQSCLSGMCDNRPLKNRPNRAKIYCRGHDSNESERPGAVFCSADQQQQRTDHEVRFPDHANG
jgi:hypothetical protein